MHSRVCPAGADKLPILSGHALDRSFQGCLDAVLVMLFLPATEA